MTVALKKIFDVIFSPCEPHGDMSLSPNLVFSPVFLLLFRFEVDIGILGCHGDVGEALKGKKLDTLYHVTPLWQKEKSFLVLQTFHKIDQ